MSIDVLKYTLIGIGIVATLVKAIGAWKLLRPLPFSKRDGQSSQTAGKDLSPATLKRLNEARSQANRDDYLRKIKGGTD